MKHVYNISIQRIWVCGGNSIDLLQNVFVDLKLQIENFKPKSSMHKMTPLSSRPYNLGNDVNLMDVSDENLGRWQWRS